MLRIQLLFSMIALFVVELLCIHVAVFVRIFPNSANRVAAFECSPNRYKIYWLYVFIIIYGRLSLAWLPG